MLSPLVTSWSTLVRVSVHVYFVNITVRVNFLVPNTGYVENLIECVCCETTVIVLKRDCIFY